MPLTTFTARWLVVDSERVLEGGGLVVDGDGVVSAILSNRGEVRRRAQGDICDLGEGVIAPGWVNAHAHLELTGLEGRLCPGAVFPDWIGALLAEREGLTEVDFMEAVERGANRLLRGGTTTVGEVDSTGAGARVLAQHPLRAVVLREALDVGDPERAREVLAGLSPPLEECPGRTEGLSPHAPYTVSDALMEELGRLVARRPMPVQVHWNETAEEVEWARGAASSFDGLVPSCTERATLARLAAAGLLGECTSLVHANHRAAGDAELLRERGVAVVHCPGAHAWFDREPFDLRGWTDAGVMVALGTDSLAGNDGLEMGREVALLRRAQPSVSAVEAFAMGTETSARALGLGGSVGSLRVGLAADFVLHSEARDVLEELTSAQTEVLRVWIRGEEVSPSA